MSNNPCQALEKLQHDRRAKVKGMAHGQSQKPAAYFIDIVAGVDPRQAVKLKHPDQDKWVQIRSGVQETASTATPAGKRDWWLLVCENGPPCDMLKKLLEE